MVYSWNQRRGSDASEDRQGREGEQRMRPFTVMLSAGHGGKDSGAISPYTIVPEKTFNLDYCKLVGEMLTDYGIWVIHARSHDFKVPLGERVRLADSMLPDLFLSIHCNAFGDPRARGAVAFYRDTGKKAATTILGAYAKHMGLKNRGAKHDIRDLQRKLRVLDADNRCRPVLLELGFLTNQTDLQMFSNIDIGASAIVKGILKWKEEGAS